MRLAGKVAIVTGGSSGFGRATAVRFAEEGARVVIADLDEAGGKETGRQVAAAGSEAELVVGDISTLAGARARSSARSRASAGLDVLVNNAGIAQTDARDTWDAAEETWDRVIRVNLRSVYACSKAAIPVDARARPRLGRERRVDRRLGAASAAPRTRRPRARSSATRGTWPASSRTRGVRVNCVSPGYMRTPMSTGERDGLSPEEQDARIAAFGERVPMRRAGSVDDIANAILYLASDEAAYVTGQEIVIDGGYLVR